MNSVQAEPSLGKKKREGYSLAGAISIFIHIGLFLFIGGAVIIEQIIPKQTMTGELDLSDSIIIDQPEPDDIPEDPAQPSDIPEVNPPAAASAASPFDMNTVVMEAPSSSFTLPALGNSSASLAPLGTASASGGTGTGAGKEARKVTFFGIESEAKSVGFYLDFSGTMDAGRKKKLLVELEKTLKALPDGMQVMVINWAGPAWTLEEQGTAVLKLWKGVSQYNWVMEAPDKIKAPGYFKLNNKNREKILTLLEGTSMVAGATAWSSPFILASKAELAPDVIYFMTDGQFGEQKGMIDNLNQALKNTKPSNPVINVVGISPQGAAAKSLKELASKHDGKYIEIP